MKKFNIYKILDKNKVNKIKFLLGNRYYKKFKKYKDVKKIIHILTPTHGNMGDHAIVYATDKFLKDKFSDYEILEICRTDIYKYAKPIKRVLNKEDFIVLIGGGNMGDLWIDEEIDRRFVISQFQDNKIISMPQTISFSDDENGKKEFDKTKRFYNKHNNLTVIARENKSFNIMKQAFSNANVIINPDMVLYINSMFKGNEKNRDIIMTCLRNDKEGVLGGSKENLIKNLDMNYENVFHYDTVVNKTITKEIREKELMNMLSKFSNSKIVITDRLHGMVFAAITKTPCIVTKSLDHKVTGTYEWIKDLNYVKLVNNLEFKEIKPLIEELLELTEYTDIDLNIEYFNKLKEKIM